MVQFHRLLVLKLGSMLSVTRGETHRLASISRVATRKVKITSMEISQLYEL